MVHAGFVILVLIILLEMLLR